MTKMTKAYVLEDGEVISQKTLDRYAIKEHTDGSKQILEDSFSGQYGELDLVPPLYNPTLLAQLLEINTYHYRCVKTKARDVAGIGWRLEPLDGKKNPSEEQKAKAEEFLNNPNGLLTLTEILDRFMVDYESIGYAFMELAKRKEGQEWVLDAIYHAPAHTIRIHRSGHKYCQIRGKNRVWFKDIDYWKDVHKDTGEEYELGTLPEDQRANEMFRMVNYTSRSDYYGLPDVMPALAAILGDRERQEYNISFFENHAVPAYAVTVTGAELDEETERTIKDFFHNKVKKSRHSTLVLTAAKDPEDESSEPIEIKFQALSVDIKEASFRMYRTDNRDEVLSAHGVPPYRAGIAEVGSLGGTTAQESTEIYKQSVVQPKQEILEERITRYILQMGLGVTDWKFKFEEMDTRDRDKELERLERQQRMAALSPNEVRTRLGLEIVDHPAMDTYYLNGQPIALNGQPIAGPLVDGNREDILKAVKGLHQELANIVRKSRQGSHLDLVKKHERSRGASHV